MFFLISKLFAFFTLPSNLVISAMLLGTLLLFTRMARAGRWLLVIASLAILVIGISPLGRLMTIALEDRFPAWDASRGAPTGFIVLGGSVSAEIAIARGTAGLAGSAERLTVVPLLAAKYPEAKFVFTGGNASIFGGPAEADQVIPLFESFGVPHSRVTIESASRNTTENAEFTRKLLDPKPGERWVVVTSAFHMPRSIGSFRAAGFDVEAYPVDYRTTGSDGGDLFQNFGSGFGFVDISTRLYLVMLMYRLAGRSSELFPAPRQASSIAR
jgi:uncharacterized SAM-binding protein YcdF (DUF218 family)